MQETKFLLPQDRLKEKLGKQDFDYDMEEVFEPVTAKQAETTENQEQLSEKQLQTLRASSQTITQAIGQQTQGFVQAIRESSIPLNKNLQKSINEGIQKYNEITNRNNQVLTNLVNSNTVDSSIVKTVSILPNDKIRSQFNLEPVEGSSNLFITNLTNPQQVIIKGSTMIFPNCNTYIMNQPRLSYFISNTQIDKEIQNVKLIYNFLKDMNYDLNDGDKKSSRYTIIEYLFQPQFGSELDRYSDLHTPSRSKSPIYLFLPSDPNELVDQLKLIALENVGGNDNPMLSEQIIAIVDKLLEYECITTNQPQKITSSFS